MQEAVIKPATQTSIRHWLLDQCEVEEKVKPTVYAMAGIPGAGKSTFVRMAIENRYFPKKAFILNPDLVMELIPEYQDDRNTIGPEDAFLKWEMPSRKFAYQLLKEAGQRHLPIIKDMGMVRAENWRMLMELRARGYAVVLHHVICDADEAVRRCAGRERHFPAQRVYERARELDALMVDFAGIADKILRFDNTDLERPFIPLQAEVAARKMA